MSKPAKPVKFKFYWIDAAGNATPGRQKSGTFDDETFLLDGEELAVDVIVSSEAKDEHLILTVPTEDENGGVTISALVLSMRSKRDAEKVKVQLDLIRSRNWAEQHRKELAAKGEEHRFRSEVCPNCDASLILTDMPETEQLYCHFCDTLSRTHSDEEPIPQEKELRLCEDCGMYTKPQKFTLFYFYFLVVFYGWWSKPTWRCPPCMRGEAWKMLFGNFLFVLGVPVAIVQLIRSYGGSSVGGRYKGLDAGNIHARKGNLVKAVENYRAILEQVPTTAGVKYNLGLALIAQGDMEKAISSFERDDSESIGSGIGSGGLNQR